MDYLSSATDTDSRETEKVLRHTKPKTVEFPTTSMPISTLSKLKEQSKKYLRENAESIGAVKACFYKVVAEMGVEHEKPNTSARIIAQLDKERDKLNARLKKLDEAISSNHYTYDVADDCLQDRKNKEQKRPKENNTSSSDSSSTKRPHKRNKGESTSKNRGAGSSSRTRR